MRGRIPSSPHLSTGLQTKGGNLWRIIRTEIPKAQSSRNRNRACWIKRNKKQKKVSTKPLRTAFQQATLPRLYQIRTKTKKTLPELCLFRFSGSPRKNGVPHFSPVCSRRNNGVPHFSPVLRVPHPSRSARRVGITNDGKIPVSSLQPQTSCNHPCKCPQNFYL